MSALKKLGQLFSQKALRSLSAGVAVSSIVLGLGAFAKPASAVVIGGQDLNEQAFADELRQISGTFVTSGGFVQNVFIDSSVESYAFSNSPGAFVTLGFSKPIRNDAGNDLALFEIGDPDSFSVEINGITRDYLTFETGDFTTNPVFSINLATLDFSDFGIALGDFVNEIKIGLDTTSPDYGTRPSLALVAGIRSTPEPSAMFGLLATVGFFACQRKFKLAKKA